MPASRGCLLVAAALGLVVANSPAGPAVDSAMHVYLGIPGVFELSVEHWIKDGLLAIFFFVVAVELQFELTSGELNSARKATQPAIAAAGGILVPVAMFLLFAAGTDSASGWPVPTATDEIETPGAATSGLIELSPLRGPDELNEA